MGSEGASLASGIGRIRPAPVALSLRLPALLGEPALAGRAGRPGRTATTEWTKAGRDPLPHPVDGELAVARLAAGVLRNRRHPGSETRPQAALLLVVERLGGVDLEHGLDSRGGHVRVLAAGPRRAARPQLDLRQGDFEDQ